ncbi:hypothetical protein C2845_PMPSC006798 [Panicum miliaceum]|uniref:Uncharacterized protein n=1 Tax=Panicum miliaceum TaxID=4540 RepID=A0A3L6PB96_PANMI|nr:hypothetical protein C2845_PMPSC006798 [Panicum miliaceum]
MKHVCCAIKSLNPSTTFFAPALSPDRCGGKYSGHYIWIGQPPQDQPRTRTRWIQLRQQCLDSKRKGFDSLFALVSWQIWKERNARVFRQAEASVLQLLAHIKRDTEL